MIEKQYLANRVATANEGQLVLIVYEGLLDQLSGGIQAADEENSENLRMHTEKSREILAELLATLEGHSEIAIQLRRLYLYINELITKGVNDQSSNYFKQATQVLTPIYEGWQQLVEKSTEEEDTNKQEKRPAIVAGMTYGKGQLNDYVLNDEGNRWKKG